MSVLCVFQGMTISGFMGVIITSLEKRFNLKSSDTGMIPSSFDVACVLSLIPVAYFGGMGRKPRWLGFGLMLMSFGCFVFALPHFTTDLYQYESTTNKDYCERNTSYLEKGVCEKSTSKIHLYKYVFILAMVLCGIGSTPLYTLGVTYIDENVTQKQSTLYVGKHITVLY